MPILSMKGHKNVDYLTKNFLIDTMQLKATYIASHFGRPEKSSLGITSPICIPYTLLTNIFFLIQNIIRNIVFYLYNGLL